MRCSDWNPGAPFQAWFWMYHWQKKTSFDLSPSPFFIHSLSFTHPGAQNRVKHPFTLVGG